MSNELGIRVLVRDPYFTAWSAQPRGYAVVIVRDNSRLLGISINPAIPVTAFSRGVKMATIQMNRIVATYDFKAGEFQPCVVLVSAKIARASAVRAAYLPFIARAAVVCEI